MSYDHIVRAVTTTTNGLHDIKDAIGLPFVALAAKSLRDNTAQPFKAWLERVLANGS